MAIFKRFADDRSGNFGIMTALLAVPLIVSAGVVVDYSAANLQKTNLQQIADSAALAGAKIFDGTNLPAAKVEAEKFIDGYEGKIPADTAFNITADGRVLNVGINGSVDTSFMSLANIKTVKVGVTASAVSPPKPTKITFTPTNAQGYWYKVISIMVVRPNSTAEQVLGTIVYQPTTLNNSGEGTMTVTPSNGEIDLGKYTKLVLKMEIKTDYCPIGYAGSASNDSKRKVTCTIVDDKYKKNNPSTWKSKMSYNSTLRTDNPDQMDSLYVDGKQLTKGTTYPLESYFGCSDEQKHAWEDGGGKDRQDFFYTISADCSGTDSSFVRLTK